MRSRYIVLLLLYPLLLSANYSIVVSQRVSSAIDRMPHKSIADYKNIPQNLSYYAYQAEPISARKQRVADRKYNKKFFSPWSMHRIDKSLKDMSWAFRSVQRHKIYDSRGHLIKAPIYNSWIVNSNFGEIDSVGAYAITIKHSNLHAFPMREAYYMTQRRQERGFHLIIIKIAHTI